MHYGCFLHHLPQWMVNLCACLALPFQFLGQRGCYSFRIDGDKTLVFQVAYDSSQAAYPGSNSDFLLPISMSIGGYVISEKGDVSLTIQPTVDSFQMGAAGYVRVWILCGGAGRPY